MKKKSFRLAVAHVAVASSLALAVLLVLDNINPRMGFLRTVLSLATAAASLLSALVFGIWEIVSHARTVSSQTPCRRTGAGS